MTRVTEICGGTLCFTASSLSHVPRKRPCSKAAATGIEPRSQAPHLYLHFYKGTRARLLLICSFAVLRDRTNVRLHICDFQWDAINPVRGIARITTGLRRVYASLDYP